MANIIEMPKLSDTMTVGTLVKWLKQEGDAVKNGDMLAEVETDKATMELECFFDGILLKIFTPAGSQVDIGTPLCAVGAAGEKVEAPAGSAPAKPAAPAEAKAKEPAPAEEPSQPKEKEQPAPTPAPPPSGRTVISPYAKKEAAAKGIDPSALRGSGPGGRIVQADVAAAERAVAAGPAAEGTLTPVSNMRATIARRLLESKTQIPHFYVEIEIDAEPLLTLRGQLNATLEAEGLKLSVNDFILKASAEALKKVPALNASWEPKAAPPAIRQNSAAHVSFAVAIPDGLITPVIRNTDTKSLLEIARESRTLAEAARTKKLQPAQFTGGTFCVSNLGMKGIDRFYAIINPPNAAILAVGAILKKPVVKNDAVVVGQRLSLGLSCDHRVVNGAEGADYLVALKDLLETPALLLL